MSSDAGSDAGVEVGVEVGVGVEDRWPVQMEQVVEADRAAALYAMYLEAFGPLAARAAARHVIERDEFDHEMADARIRKYTIWRNPESPVALATITNDLAAMPWVSPDFFAARHPEQARRRAIHYLGLALVAPARGQFRLLERLVQEVVAECVEQRGVLAYDVCRWNDTRIRFGRRAEAILRRIAPVQVGVADVQTYYEAVFE